MAVVTLILRTYDKMIKRMKNTISSSLRAMTLALVSFFVCGQAFAQEQTAAAPEQYILQAGDQIYIQVFDEPDLTMQATVAQSGSINYSYLGPIEVAGRSPQQLTESITAKLQDGYLKNPSVNITVERYRSFFVDGEVKSPGSYGYEPGLTLAKAVSLAGGMTDRASRRKIFLTREVQGEKQSYRVEMSQTIEPGDVITIKEGFF